MKCPECGAYRIKFLGAHKFDAETGEEIEQRSGCYQVVSMFTVVGWGLLLLALGILAVTGEFTGGAGDHAIALAAGGWGIKILVDVVREVINGEGDEADTKIIQKTKFRCSACQHEWYVQPDNA